MGKAEPREPGGTEGVLDRVDSMIARVLEASHLLPPDELAPLLRQEATRIGFADFGLYLADHAQTALTATEGDEVVPIDGSLPGRCYQTDEPTEGEGPHGRRLWVPLRDGVERLGVVRFDAAHFGARLVERCRHLATVAAEVTVSKLQYGDSLVRLRRREPFTLAAELRWAILPPLTFTTPRASVACMLAPASSVAGDAFDYAINGKLLHVAVFDAMGHGVEAARLGNLAVAAYRNGRRHDADLQTLYRELGAAIRSEFRESQFVTAHLTVLDTDDGTLRWINAGHPRPLLIRQGRVSSQLEGDPSPPLGVSEGEGVIREVALEPGDVVLFFSDGLIEARSETGETFGEKRLFEVISRTFTEAHSLAEAARRLMAAAIAEHGTLPADDATLALMGWSGPET